MTSGSDILGTVTLFVAAAIAGCATSGGYRVLYGSTQELSSIEEIYSAELSKLEIGMNLEDFRVIFPEAYPVAPYESTGTYQLENTQNYVFQQDIDWQNFHWLFGSPKPRTIKTVLFFYFSDDKLSRWGKPTAREPIPRVTTKGIIVGTGTGFAISTDGLIVTAYHIIEDATIASVHLSQDSSVFAKVVHSDPMNDLAVLKIEKPTPNFLQIAPMRSAKTGDRVFTMGFPVSSFLGQEPKYTEGVISALSGVHGAASLLQITVPIQPGNSGGPLVNKRGEVVGIITSTAAISRFIKESGTLPQNVNWAVKADYLRLMIDLPEAEQTHLDREQLIAHVKKATFLIDAIQ